MVDNNQRIYMHAQGKIVPELEIRTCEYCCNENCCCSRYEDYECTREAGHKGPHIACGTVDHEMSTWYEPVTSERRPR